MKYILTLLTLLPLLLHGTYINTNKHLYNYTIRKLQYIEHYKPFPYKLGFSTYIGYGHRNVENYKHLTKSEAVQLLKRDLNKHMSFIRNKHVGLSYNKVLALASFSMSIGSTKYSNSSVAVCVYNNLALDTVIIKYCYYNKKYSNRLKVRREFELKLYNKL
jgi:GH24 family phage-related lysozyme (muramidase)